MITRTGDAFLDQIDGPSLGEIFKPALGEDPIEGAKLPQRLLDLAIPVLRVRVLPGLRR